MIIIFDQGRIYAKYIRPGSALGMSVIASVPVYTFRVSFPLTYTTHLFRAKWERRRYNQNLGWDHLRIIIAGDLLPGKPKGKLTLRVNSMLRTNLIKLVHLSLLVFSVTACGIAAATPSAGPIPTKTTTQTIVFKISFLQNKEMSRNLGTEVETSWPLLIDAYPDSSVLTLSEDDVAYYQWEQQAIRLTVDGSNKLISLTKDPYKTRQIPELYLQNLPFVVSVDDNLIYGGLFTSPGSAMYINFPVIYPSVSGDYLILTIRPFHTVSPTQYDEFSTTNPQWNGIKDDRILKALDESGKLLK